MSVADHLNVRAEEYDVTIRTFVPHYEPMLDEVAGTLRFVEADPPTIVDLGAGTGGLAARCLEVRPGARLVGIDSDPEMLGVARARLAGHDDVDLVAGDFRTTPIPPCDAIVSCIAIHHIPTAEEKRALYRACADALRPGGLFINGDRFTSRDPDLAGAERRAWFDHLRRTYSPEESEAHLAAWGEEDFYFPLTDELEWIEETGLTADVTWRAAGNAVVVARKGG